MIDKEKLEEVKRFYQTANADQRYVIERLFPELAESEDERISREITEFIVNFHNGNYEKPYDYTIGTWLAWLDKQAGKDKRIQEILSQQLEKQGEQKLVDNVEPKFKVGDTMRTLQEANNGYTHGMPVVVSIDNEYYHCTNELIAIKDQDDYEFPPINVKQKYADKVKPKFHEGDWVVCEVTSSVYQIKNCIENLHNHRCGYVLTNGGYIGSDEVNHYHLWTIQDAKPGDVLVTDFEEDNMIVMYHSMCTIDTINVCCCLDNKLVCGNLGVFDAEDVHPATEEQCDLLFQKIYDAGYEWDAKKKELRKIEQSELTEFEDAVKDMMNAYRDAIGDNDVTTEEVKKHATYLLYLIPHKPTAWSEEDEEMFNHIIELLEGLPNLHNWLKSLKDRVQLQLAWNEEDEHRLKDTIYFLDTAKNHYASTVELDACINWLKSLKPHNMWKPSKEQIIALRWILNNIPYNKHKEEIRGLLDQIKDL